MKDIYRKNKHSGQPMAVRSIDTMDTESEKNETRIEKKSGPETVRGSGDRGRQRGSR